MPTTYKFTPPTGYVQITNYTQCSNGKCGVFSPLMTMEGFFTTGSPLPPNLSESNIAAQVTSYSFSDGLVGAYSINPNSRIWMFQVTTDSSGVLTNWKIRLQLWTTGSTPHTTSDRLDFVMLDGGSDGFTAAFNNVPCTSVGVGPSGVPDVALEIASDEAGSSGSAVSGSWTVSSDASAA